MEASVRPATPQDDEVIREIHRLAFGRNDEARLIEELRAGGYVRASLIAERLGTQVGHVLFSVLSVEAPGPAIVAVALAPIAVLPEHQGMGVGTALVRTGLEVCRQAGYGAAFVVGEPAIYSRLGFDADLARQFECVYACDAFQAVELVPGTLAGRSGRIDFAPPFAGLS